MRQPRQLSLFKDPRKNTKMWWIVKQTTYGGSFDYRKVKRPFDSKKLVHVVLKGQLGPGIWFTRSQKSILNLLEKVAIKYSVTIKEKSINKDHIHILVSAKERAQFLLFLRYFSAEMGRKYAGVFKQLGLQKTKSIWLKRPFTRLVSWGKRSVANAIHYIQKNTLEALGFLPYQPRHHRICKFFDLLQSIQKQV